MAEKSKSLLCGLPRPQLAGEPAQKLARLMMTAGFGDIDMDGKYVAIKMHFGEAGQAWPHLRPNWARAWWTW